MNELFTEEQKNLLRDAIFDRNFIQGICDYAEFEEEGLSYTLPEMDSNPTPEDLLRATIAAKFEIMAVAVYSVVAGDYRAYEEEYEAECEDEDDDNSPNWDDFVFNNIWDAIKYVAEGSQYCELAAEDIEIAIDNCLSEAVDLGFEDPFTALLEALENFFKIID